MPRAPTSEMAAKLRSKAREHPTVATLDAQLPTLPESGAPDQGLYIETRKTPGLTVNGELRVSVARIKSVGPDGPRLVGQIQAVRAVDHPLESWELRLFEHEPEYFSTERHDDPEAWFVRLLDLHYEATDAQADIELDVTA